MKFVAGVLFCSMILWAISPTVMDLVDLKNYGITCDYRYESGSDAISCEMSIEDAIQLMQYLHQLENSATIET